MNLRSKKLFCSLFGRAVLILAVMYSLSLQVLSENSINPDNLLFIDFAVTGNGTTQVDLDPEQVSITIDGVARDVVYLSRITPEVITPDNPNSWIVANQLRGQQSLILLLDLLSLDNAALSNTRANIEALLNSMPENHNRKIMLAVLGSNLSFVQPFTSDKNKILEELDKVQVSFTRLDYKQLIKSISDIFSIQYDQNPSQAMEESIREANQFMVQVESRRESAIAGLETFAEWFTGLSGPKNVLLFSAGYPLMPSPVVHDIVRVYNEPSGTGSIIPISLLSAKIRTGGDSDVSGKITELTAKFNRNQLSLFTFDSRDVKSDGLAASGIRWLPQRLVASHNSSHITEGHEFLKNISEPTKGSFVYDQQTLLKQIDGTGWTSYIAAVAGEAGVEPGEPGSIVKVSVSGIGGKANDTREVGSRNSFFSLKPASSRETLAGAFNFPDYFSDFSVSFNIGAGKGLLNAEAVLSPESLTFVRERDKYFCMLEIFGVLTDSAGNTVTGDKSFTFAKQFPLRMDESQLRSLLSRKTVSASASASGIEPGEYSLTVVVRQPRSGLISSSKMDISME